MASGRGSPTSAEVAAGPESAGRRWALLLTALGTALLGVTLYGALVVAPRERERFVEQWHAQRDARADDRRAAIDMWLSAAIADVRVVAGYPTLVFLLSGAAAPPREPGIGERPHLESLLGELLTVHAYQSATVFGRDLAVAGAAPKDRLPDPACTATARRCIAGGAPVVDAHLRGGRPEVAVAAPVFSDASRAHVVGAVVVTTDPRLWLFPFLAVQPRVSRTGETVLFQREGEEAVYITPLRHDPGAPLTVRRPLGTAGFAAAHALAGDETFSRYVDYRGVAVLAAPRALRNAPWGLVVKVDEAEVLELYHRWFAGALALLVAFAAALLGVVYGLWRREGERRALALARSEAELARLLDHANDTVLYVSQGGVILRANRRAQAMYGYSADELRGMPIVTLRRPALRGEVEALLALVIQKGNVVFETEHVRKDGSTIAVEVSVSSIRATGDVAILSIIRDISDRRRAEQRIERLNRLLRTISEINQLIVRARRRGELLAQACSILVEHGRFALVWIGFADPASGLVQPTAWAGAGTDDLQDATLRFDDSELGHGPTWTAIREQRIVVVDDWANDERVAPWRGMASARGFRSSAAVPLGAGAGRPGAVTLYSNDAAAFDGETQALLDELAGDIAFALDSIAARETLERQDEALRGSEQRLAAIIANTQDAYVRAGLDGHIVMVSPSAARMYGYPSAEAMVGVPAAELYAEPAERESVKAELLRHGRVHDRVGRGRRRDGGELWVSLNTQFFMDERGEVAGTEGFVRDITERRQAEEALKESEQRFRTLFESMNEGVAIHELCLDERGAPVDYRIVSVNPAYERHVGLRRGEVEGRLASAAYGSGTAPFLDEYAQVALSGRPETLDRFFAPLARHFTISVSSPRRGAFVTVFADVTERRRAEEALRSSEERYRSLFENMLNGFAYCRMLWDGDRPADFVYLAVNDAFTSLTGLRDAEGKRVSEVIPGIREADPELFERAGRVTRTGVSDRFETWVEALQMWFSISVYRPAADHFVAVFDVITERKRAEEALRASEKRYRRLHESMTDAFVSVDMSGRITESNRAYQEMLGYSQDELQALTYERLTPERWHALEADLVREQILPNGFSGVYEKEYRRKDGAIFPVELRTFLVTDDAGRPAAMWAIVRDISERKRAEADLHRLNEGLEQRVEQRTAQLAAANKELEAFAYSVSHDLRAPLRAIDGFSRMLVEDHAAALDGEGLRLAGVIRENTQRMAQLIDDLLAFSRIGRTEMRRATVDMRAIAESAFRELAGEDGASRVELHLGDLPPVVGDQGLLRQVWANLLGNALKFSARCDRPRVEIRGGREGGELVYHVADNGVGFDMRYADKLFGVFQRLHSMKEFPGTGVGLALVQRIVARHGGRVWGVGAPDQGATFSFSLPATDGDV